MRRFTTHSDGHSTLQMDGFSISYQPASNISIPDGSDGETALINDLGKPTFLILKGDWRTQYEAVADDGYEACLTVYEDNKATHRSKWSEDETYLPTVAEVLAIVGDVLKRPTH